MAKRNVGFGAAILLMSILGYIYTYSIPVSKTIKISAAFFPQIIFGIMALLSLSVLVTGYKGLKKEVGQSKKEDKEKVDAKLLVITLLLTVAYGIIMPVLGFISTSILYLITQIWFMTKEKTKKSIAISIVVSVGMSVFLYYIFANLFYVALPSGILF